MIDPDSLNVWSENKLVGYLWRNATGSIGFKYSSDWCKAKGNAISLTLPVSTDEYIAEDGIAHRFFSNLLPEGDVRSRIVRDLKISNTDFELLRAVGGECAGALTVLPVERNPSQDNSYRLLNNTELEQIIERRGQVYAATSANQRPRLSLAGAQDKCPVMLEKGQYYLPELEAPSSHILKFEIPDYRHLPAYETFTTLLADRIRLPVVNMKLCDTGKHNFAQIERYDRIRNKTGQLVRLHQEDFCQALGYSHEKKYQDNGGPSFADCYHLLQNASSDPITDTQNLLRWQIFNLLAGNSDGHAKNISLLYLQNGETRLAPFYDLICTRAIERIDVNLAFDVGGERDPGHITDAHWEELAAQCDVAARLVRSLVQHTRDSLLAQLKPTRQLYEAQYGKYPALQRIEKVVREQCRGGDSG